MTLRPRPTSDTRPIVIAAIDFGTTCTGYAYYLRRDSTTSLSEIISNQGWRGCAESGLQAPTTVLMDSKRMFHSFGFEAEEHYKMLSLHNKHDDWYFFRHFKMKLHHEKDLHRDIMIPEAGGKQMKAMVVFAAAIKYVKEHLLKKLKDSLREDVGPREITWVITVPAIWRHSAKQFMREAASKAGIPSGQLSLALEPESAAIFCKEQALNKVGGVDGIYLRAFDPGQKYIVVDCGGGTVDTTGHQVLPDGTLKELHAATGGPWGGQLVNEAFEKFISDMVTKSVFDSFRHETTNAWLEFHEDFETAKRKYSYSRNDVTLRFPQYLVTKFKEMNKLQLEERLQENKYKKKVLFVQGHIVLKSVVMDDLFKHATDEINKHIDLLLKKKELTGVSTLLLVGGFSESPFVSEAVRLCFKSLRVIAPSNGSLAILKGAVMFGINSKVIAVRVSPFSYGVHTRKLYIQDIHPPKRARKVHGHYYVDNAFDKHMEIGERVYVGSASKERQYKICNKGNRSVYWKIYQSTIPDPLFCDSEYDCSYLGKLVVNIPEVSHISDDVDNDVGAQQPSHVRLLLSMACKGSELEATARVPEMNIECGVKFDFLDFDHPVGEDDVVESVQ